MNKEIEIEKKIKKITKKYNLNIPKDKNLNFSKDTDLDSFALLNLIIEIENLFNIKLFSKNKDLNIQNYKDLIKVIKLTLK